MGLSVNRVARDIRLPATRLHEIIHQRRGVTAATAIALGAYFNQNSEFWMNVQTAYERPMNCPKNWSRTAMTSARVSAVMPRTVQPLRSGLCRGLSGLMLIRRVR